MAELYIHEPIFPGTSGLNQIDAIFKIMGTPDALQWKDGYKLAKSKGIKFKSYKKQNLSDIIPYASEEAVDVME